ncbi:MAG: phosphogluconate dehydratase [Pseudomonadota bacterium]
MSDQTLHPTLEKITQRIEARSQVARAAYLEKIEHARRNGPHRGVLSCGNLAHGFAACAEDGKEALSGSRRANIGVISAYNDMLSAHQPLEIYPRWIKEAAWAAGGMAQFAGGVPAMCDGVTQGQPGMELSLFSRDVIAMATAVSLSHNMFDAAICLGVCDKIVPGLLIGALSFGHLPVIMVPAGPMPSGLPNDEKARVRQLHAEGKVGRDALLDAESKSYHSPGTCTFYGTANSNQLMMEFMGLHLPGTSFVNPGTPLREALTRAAAVQALRITDLADDAGAYRPIGQVLDAKAILNGMIGLLSSGGSTNHTIHLVAIAHAAGIQIDWTDFAELSDVVPLLARVYPNGSADVNHLHAAGGIQLMMRELLGAGLLHGDVLTIMGSGLDAYRDEPYLAGDDLEWRGGPTRSLDTDVLRPVNEPFSPTGGIRLMEGNLGRAIVKVSAVKDEHRVVEAPARVFQSQGAVLEAFKAGELDRDCVVVVTYQGPSANGMPELHKLTPSLTAVQSRGHSVALVTDGRMSGASGKVPAAIQVTPECLNGGPLAKVRDGDLLRVDTHAGELCALVDTAQWDSRESVPCATRDTLGMGRELFEVFRNVVTGAEQGAVYTGAADEIQATSMPQDG